MLFYKINSNYRPSIKLKQKLSINKINICDHEIKSLLRKSRLREQLNG